MLICKVTREGFILNWILCLPRGRKTTQCILISRDHAKRHVSLREVGINSCVLAKPSTVYHCKARGGGIVSSLTKIPKVEQNTQEAILFQFTRCPLALWVYLEGNLIVSLFFSHFYHKNYKMKVYSMILIGATFLVFAFPAGKR